MKQILLLTDFSANSKNAITYALQLFEKQACHFLILHIPTKSIYSTSDLMTIGNNSIYDSLVKKAEKKLDKFVKTLEATSNNKHATFEAIVDYDMLTDSVNQIIKSKKIDLIVMGTNGVTGAKEVVFGSNTINVIRKVACTTLVIPKGFKYKTPKELFLPLDVYDSLNSESFLKLKRFAKKFNASFNIMRIIENSVVSETEKTDREHINTHLNDITHAYLLVKNIRLDQAINQYLETHEKMDMLTLLVQKESAFERFLTGSDTKKISQNLKVPLLILHSQ
ncbi:universal stress protein [Bizionia arctica]|nr:universal stress protein [Bizionia arctica]